MGVPTAGSLSHCGWYSMWTPRRPKRLIIYILVATYVGPAGNQDKEIIFDKVRKSTRCLRKGKFPPNFIANGKGSSSQRSVSLQELPRLRSSGPQNLLSWMVQSLMANKSSEKAALCSDASDKPTVWPSFSNRGYDFFFSLGMCVYSVVMSNAAASDHSLDPESRCGKTQHTCCPRLSLIKDNGLFLFVFDDWNDGFNKVTYITKSRFICCFYSR